MFAVINRALHDLALRKSEVARLLVLPMIANVLVEVNLVRSQIASDSMGGTGANALAFWVNMAAVAFVAVGWHRTVLLGEPARVVPPRRGGLHFRYFVSWFVLGLVIALALLLVGAALYYAFVLLGPDDPVAQQIGAYLLDALTMMHGSFAIIFVPVTAFLWLLFRFGIKLPHLALDRPAMSMGQAWALTRPQAWPIAVTAVVAGVLQTVVFVVPFLMLAASLDYETGTFPPVTEYAAALLFVIFYTFSTLVGAAILTAIYQRIDPAELPRA